MIARGWVVMLLCLLVAAPATAQDALDRARDAFDRAAFADAVAAYDEAAAGEGLSTETLRELLRGRALARHASRDTAGAEADMVALLSLDPRAELGDQAPPSLQRAFARLRGEVRAPLSLEAEARRIPDGFEIRARTIEDVAELTRTVRVSWEEGGAWQSEEGPAVRVVAGGTLRWYAEAIGPGGAVIASVGDRDDPRTATAPGVADAIAQPEQDAGVTANDDTTLHVGIGIGIGVVVAAVVATVLAILLVPGDGTQVGGPMERTP